MLPLVRSVFRRKSNRAPTGDAETPAGRARRLGSGAALDVADELLSQAVAAGPESPAGRAARTSAARVYLREAQRLARRAANSSSGADELRRTSHEFLARAAAVNPQTDV
jgi:hypothetical protein